MIKGGNEMFCGNCGAQNPDGAVHCGNCGAPLNAGPAALAGAADAAVAKRNRTIGIAVVAAIAAIIVVAVVLIAVLAGGGGSPKGVAVDMVEAVFDADIDKIVNMIPDKLIKGYAKEEGISSREAREDFTYMLKRELNDDYLGMFEFTVKAGDVEKYDRDELSDIKDMYSDFGVKVKDARTVEVEITVKLLGQKESEDIDVPVVKIGGDWYVDFLGLDGAF